MDLKPIQNMPARSVARSVASSVASSVVGSNSERDWNIFFTRLLEKHCEAIECLQQLEDDDRKKEYTNYITKIGDVLQTLEQEQEQEQEQAKELGKSVIKIDINTVVSCNKVKEFFPDKDGYDSDNSILKRLESFFVYLKVYEKKFFTSSSEDIVKTVDIICKCSFFEDYYDNCSTTKARVLKEIVGNRSNIIETIDTICLTFEQDKTIFVLETYWDNLDSFVSAYKEIQKFADLPDDQKPILIEKIIDYKYPLRCFRTDGEAADVSLLNAIKTLMGNNNFNKDTLNCILSCNGWDIKNDRLLFLLEKLDLKIKSQKEKEKLKMVKCDAESLSSIPLLPCKLAKVFSDRHYFYRKILPKMISDDQISEEARTDLLCLAYIFYRSRFIIAKSETMPNNIEEAISSTISCKEHALFKYFRAGRRAVKSNPGVFVVGGIFSFLGGVYVCHMSKSLQSLEDNMKRMTEEHENLLDRFLNEADINLVVSDLARKKITEVIKQSKLESVWISEEAKQQIADQLTNVNLNSILAKEVKEQIQNLLLNKDALINEAVTREIAVQITQAIANTDFLSKEVAKQINPKVKQDIIDLIQSDLDSFISKRLLDPNSHFHRAVEKIAANSYSEKVSSSGFFSQSRILQWLIGSGVVGLAVVGSSRFFAQRTIQNSFEQPRPNGGCVFWK